MCHSLEYLVTKFENKLLKANGNEFQMFFYKIMKWVDTDFIEIKSYGNIGDRKCDGYIKNKGIFYQVYSPEEPDKKSTIKYAKTKLLSDFKGLYKKINKEKYYEEIKEFYYVFNNKTIGVISPLFDEELRILGNEYDKIKFGYISNNDLHRYFLKLDLIAQKGILDCYTDCGIIQIKYDIIGNVVNYLAKNVSIIKRNDLLVIPNFEEKIRFNKLDYSIKIKLDNAYLYIVELEKLLSSYNIGIKQDLKNIYLALYLQSKKEYPNDSVKQFNYIVENSIPDDIKNLDNNLQENLYIQNILIIISKYFESCDIFEKPIKKQEQI